MDLATLVRKYDLTLDGVLHCGAHLVEEAEVYQQLGVGRVWWVEGNPEVLPDIRTRLLQFPGQEVIEALLWSEDGVEKTLRITNYRGMSSSILPFGTHPTFSPDTIFVDEITRTTSTIDSLMDQYAIKASFISLDLQGVEGFVLQGAQRFLSGVNSIVLEVNDRDVYEGCTKVWELDELLGDSGFERVETYWVPGQGWGDACYVRAA